MAQLEWGHAFIWIGIGVVLILTGILVSSVRRSVRRAQLSKIPRHVMTTFKPGVLSKRMMKSIEEQLDNSMSLKLASAPPAPKKSLWGWTAPNSDLGEVNFAHVISSSPRLIDHAARVYSKGAWSRHPSQSMDDFLLTLSSHLPLITEEHIAGYLERYNEVQFDSINVTKRQYSVWLQHFLVILQVLDQESPEPDHQVEEHQPSSPRKPSSNKKKKKRADKT